MQKNKDNAEVYGIMGKGMTGKYTWEEYQNLHKDLAESRFREVEKECGHLGIHCLMLGNYIHICTDRGKWKFLASETPIHLQHKNYRFRQSTLGNYHIQWIKNVSMYELVAYIFTHDKK